MITLENVGGISAAAFMKTLPISEKNNSFYSKNQFPTSETIGRMGTSFWRSNFLGFVGGQAVVKIGRRYSRNQR